MNSSIKPGLIPTVLFVAIAAISSMPVIAQVDQPAGEKNASKKVAVKNEDVVTWTDAAKAAKEFAGYQFLGEYTQDDSAIQVVPVEERYYLSIYQGGLPGDGWDGGEIKHEWVNSDGITDRLSGYEKVDRSSKLQFTSPPADATVLFDGTSMERWKNGKMVAGILQAGARTKENFQDFQLHFECMTPLKPSLPLSHPGRGNSGVFLVGAYEVQVMDTFGLDQSGDAWKETKIIKKPDTWCGSIYGIRPPTVNVCLPPLAWQTFDVEFTAARFEGKKKISDAEMTVHHNGVLIHDHVKLALGTGGGPAGPRPEVPEGPIYVQKHGNPVMYRNIWIVEGKSPTAASKTSSWIIDSTDQWNLHNAKSSHIKITDGAAKSTEFETTFSSTVKRFESKRKSKSLTLTQTDAWDNWSEIPDVGTSDMRDAPVLVPVADGDYWLLARHVKFIGKTDGGYHAWHSTDMKTWKHHGPVSGFRERWMTTAEYVDGTFFLYYDRPNDEDPHLILDKDLTDGKVGDDKGMVFNDPSHGSDCAIFREEDGTFHLIYENWDPIDAKAHSWDSPLAGHAVSPDGIQPFKWVNDVVDERTKPTGKFSHYNHGTTKDVYRYEIHEPEQEAFGDWTAIKIGSQYYLFCDYDPVGKNIRVGRWTSDSLHKKFSFCGEFGDGHPDPTIGFAEGQFYLLQQRSKVDFVSPGPWVGGVRARAGVDVSGDGKIEQWTDWQEVTETYKQKQGFVRIVDRTPATLDLTSLPTGAGFQFEFQTTETEGQSTNVVMEKVEWAFE